MLMRNVIFSVLFVAPFIVEGQFIITEVLIYKHFPDRGFTSAGLSTELRTLKSQQAESLTMARADVEILEKILNTAAVKRHRQKKTGTGPYFGVIQTEANTFDVVLFQSVVIDLTNDKEYWIRDARERELLKQLLAKFKAERGFIALCQCYEAITDTMDIYVLSNTDSIYTLKYFSNFHGEYTSFKYDFTFPEHDVEIQLKETSKTITRKDADYYIKWNVGSEKFEIKLKKKNCNNLKITRIPKEKILNNPYP